MLTPAIADNIDKEKELRRKLLESAAVDNSLEKEEALRRKLLEQMKKKVNTSVVEEPKTIEDKNVQEEVTNSVIAEGTAVTNNESNEIPEVSELASVDVKVEEKIVPTMADILKLKQDLRNVLINKRKKSLNKSSPVVSSTSATPKKSTIKPKVNTSTNSKAAKKLPNVPSKPIEKENVGTVVQQLKRTAPPENVVLFKKPRSLPEDKSKALDEFEKRDRELLFNSPRIAVRNFM